jgi:hypothetical protein
MRKDISTSVPNVRPCPSPLGTNKSRLFLVTVPPFSSKLAMDAALDPDNNGSQSQQPDNGASSDAFVELCTFLAGKLSPADMSTAEQLLTQFLDASGGEGSGAEFASDEPPAFPGRPRPGGAMDARMAAAIRSGRRQAEAFMFNKRFPNAARIRNV